jgi:hypothetical protein
MKTALSEYPLVEFIRLRSSSYDGTRRMGQFCHVVYPAGFGKEVKKEDNF